MSTYEIKWNGQSYHAADITIFVGTKDELHVTIADTTLEDEILSHMYADDRLEGEAFELDDMIAYFVEPDEWALPDVQIIKIVEQSYL